MKVTSDYAPNTGVCGSMLHQQIIDKQHQKIANDQRVNLVTTSTRWLGIGLMLVTVSPLWAAPQTPLGAIGKTQLQQDTGDAVQLTCGGIIADNGGSPPPIGTNPLFDTCSAMVQTATGGTRSLGITNDQLADGLQQIATEEFGASGQLGTEVGSNQINIGLNRLVDIRKGVRGFSVTGLSPDSKTLLAADSQWTKAYRGEQGGAAGDGDTPYKLGVFLTGNYSTGNRDRTDQSDEFDFDTNGATLGMDYRFTESLVLGAAIVYNKVKSDFAIAPTVAGGGVDADGWGGFAYGTYYKDRFYIDGLAGYASTNYDIVRNIFVPNNGNTSVYGGNNIVATANASTDSNDYTLSAGAGYYFSQDAWSYGPYGRLSYYSVDVNNYRETGAEIFGLNLNVDGQKWKSLTSVIGGQFSYSSSQNFGVLVPQGRLAWVHEFKSDAQTMAATYVTDVNKNVLVAQTDNPDRNYFEFGLGVSSVFKNGVQAFLNYDTVLGLDKLTAHYFSLGGRWEF